jgi:hypothetical protein
LLRLHRRVSGVILLRVLRVLATRQTVQCGGEFVVAPLGHGGLELAAPHWRRPFASHACTGRTRRCAFLLAAIAAPASADTSYPFCLPARKCRVRATTFSIAAAIAAGV